MVSLSGDKAPGPDGFQMEVYKKAWHFMKKEFVAVFREFSEHRYWDCRLNTNFISLIPKIEGENEIYDFRLICLLNGVYKILGKC